MEYRKRSDREIIAKLLTPKKSLYTRGLRGIPVEDKYYTPEHFVPLDITTELGTFDLKDPNILLSGVLIAVLAWWLYKRYV